MKKAVTTKTIKKTKDKDAPKKNKSAYMFFCDDERSVIKQELPDLNNKEVLVELGSRWSKLKEQNPDKVKVFEDLASKDKERYLLEKGNADSSDDKPKKKESKKKNKDKTDDAVLEDDNEATPKKTIRKNGYINFCKEMRAEIKEEFPELKPKEITKKLAEKWNELSAEEKERYKEL